MDEDKKFEKLIASAHEYRHYSMVYVILPKTPGKEALRYMVETITQRNQKSIEPLHIMNTERAKQTLIEKTTKKHSKDPNFKEIKIINCEQFPFLDKKEAEEYAKKHNDEEDRKRDLAERLKQ